MHPSSHYLLLLFLLLLPSPSSPSPSPLSLPLLPFSPVWNAPTAACLSRYGVDLDLGTFHILHNRNQTLSGDMVAIFYSDRLGLYPHYAGTGSRSRSRPRSRSRSRSRSDLQDIQGGFGEILPDREFAIPGMGAKARTPRLVDRGVTLDRDLQGIQGGFGGIQHDRGFTDLGMRSKLRAPRLDVMDDHLQGDILDPLRNRGFTNPGMRSEQRAPGLDVMDHHLQGDFEEKRRDQGFTNLGMRSDPRPPRPVPLQGDIPDPLLDRGFTLPGMGFQTPRAVNGGVPQNASLELHLQRARGDIARVLPDRGFTGLAVVDWEAWRPVWERNWDAKRVYQEGSRALVQARHPDWPPQWVESQAQQELQGAGRSFMEQTLGLGRRERPGGMWGFYGFPDCYNHPGGGRGGRGGGGGGEGVGDYTGECPEVEKRRNDELAWLWEASGALYPQIYLGLDMRGRPDQEVALYVRHRLLEAGRAARLGWQGLRGRALRRGQGPRRKRKRGRGLREEGGAKPVFPYSRIVYTYSLDFLSQEHLVSTIGESAAQGCAGVVLWGDDSFAQSQASCRAVRSFVDASLGPYLANVTAATLLCSSSLCSSHGRCQRREGGGGGGIGRGGERGGGESERGGGGAMLHLDPARWKVVAEEWPPGGRRHYAVLRVEEQEERKKRRRKGGREEEEEEVMRKEFQCLCYPGWSGKSCSRPA